MKFLISSFFWNTGTNFLKSCKKSTKWFQSPTFHPHTLLASWLQKSLTFQSQTPETEGMCEIKNTHNCKNALSQSLHCKPQQTVCLILLRKNKTDKTGGTEVADYCQEKNWRLSQRSLHLLVGGALTVWIHENEHNIQKKAVFRIWGNWNNAIQSRYSTSWKISMTCELNIFQVNWSHKAFWAPETNTHLFSSFLSSFSRISNRGKTLDPSKALSVDHNSWGRDSHRNTCSDSYGLRLFVGKSSMAS